MFVDEIMSIFVLFLFFGFIDRVYFNQHNQPAFLQIDPVQTKDAGEYRCRVDFKKARTVNIVIQLKVIGMMMMLYTHTHPHPEYLKKKFKKKILQMHYHLVAKINTNFDFDFFFVFAVPPEEPIISYKYSQSTSHPLKGLIGPFNEGDRLVLVCTSFGGKTTTSNQKKISSFISFFFSFLFCSFRFR